VAQGVGPEFKPQSQKKKTVIFFPNINLATCKLSILALKDSYDVAPAYYHLSIASTHMR
jgi:hypothetical protein